MRTAVTATRYHDFSCGHRVVGHESKCAFLHGHNYRVTFTVESRRIDGLDAVGRVLDFSDIKDKLCEWLEQNWDHKFLAWERDPLLVAISSTMGQRLINAPAGIGSGDCGERFDDSIIWVPFNPTAENMALYLLEVIGPKALEGTDTKLVAVFVEETRKCSAGASFR